MFLRHDAGVSLFSGLRTGILLQILEDIVEWMNMTSPTSKVSFSTAKPVLLTIGGMTFLLVLLVGYIWIEENTKTPIKAVYRTLDTNSLVYTVTETFHTDNVERSTKENGSYVIVCLEIQNRTPRWIDHALQFRLTDSKDQSYGITCSKTILANNDYYRHSDHLREPLKSITWRDQMPLPLRFGLMSESSEFIFLIFEVPKESLSRTWALLIRDRDDNYSIGAIKVGPISTGDHD